MVRRRPTLPVIWGLLAVVLAWMVLGLVVPDRILPGPIPTVVRTGSLLFSDDLGLHLGASLARIVVALVFAFLIGVPVGIAMGANRTVGRVLNGPLYVLYPAPKIAFLPVLMLLIGLGNTAKVVLIVVIVVFQFLFAARDGTRAIPRSLVLSAKSLRLGRLGYLAHVVFPALLPRLFGAIRLSLGISFSVVFFAESFATRYGIGFFIVNAWAQLAYPEMYAGILALGVVGFLLFRLVDLWERLACPWARHE